MYPDRFDYRKKINLNECAIGGTFFIERDLLFKLNGFRQIMLGTDADLYDRIVEAGIQVNETKIPTYIYHHENEDSITNMLFKNNTETQRIFSELTPNNTMKAFSKTEVKDHLAKKLSKWSSDGTFITRSFKLKNFVNAFSFMTAVALEAEKMDHHPEWSNVYNSVTINLNTHDASGITQLDIDLAESIDRIFDSYAEL